MTQDEIIRMAREAGFDTDLPSFKDGTAIALKLAALVAAHVVENLGSKEILHAYNAGKNAGIKDEREACAKVCEPVEGSAYEVGVYKTMQTLAAAIRSRSDK